MSMPSEATADDPTGSGWTLIALVAAPGVEPPPGHSERAAQGAWCALSALWNPALLARANALPRVENVAAPTPPGPREIRVVADEAADRLPSGYRTQAEDAGALLIDGGGDRPALVRTLQERLGAVGTPETSEADDMAAVALDFQALGTAHAWLRDLTTAMAHADCLDHESLTRETLAGAAAWQAGDRPTAVNRLRAAFELLTQARERFYPVDVYLIDIFLLDPAMPAGVLTEALAPRTHVTFLATAQAIENLAARDPAGIAALRAAIVEGWADVAGGAYSEADEPLAPIESIFWQFRKGGATYRTHLDERNVETVARRRFGLYPQLPQIAKRFGFRFALHMGFDAGRFPIRPEAKRLWESPDNTSLETLTRLPLGADKAVSGALLPWRLALTMKDDHVATLSLVHWPHGLASWYLDLRRVAGYSPVLARWVTLNDYFHLTDRPYESFRPEPDQYVTPYLAQAVARRKTDPISGRAAHARLRARLDAVGNVQAVARALTSLVEPIEAPSLVELEDLLETGRGHEVGSGLAAHESAWSHALARGIVGARSGGRPGYFVFNPLGVARRIAVPLPDAAADLHPEGPLLAAQLTEDGVWAVVELPAFGYAWVPRESNPEMPPAPTGKVSARDRVLSNDSLRVEIDKTTGGIRSLCAVGEETARVGQQLVVGGLTGTDGGPVATRMIGDRFEIDYAGPALVQAFSRGELIDPRDNRRLARFQQRYRLWTGRPVLELEITLTEIDADWLARAADADPWSHYLACRWAWPDPNSMVRRTCLLAPELTEADRPETPDAFDISTRRQRTALLFGGLAHHRRHGGRMLDTLLVAGRESERVFQLGMALDLEHPFQAAFDLTGPAFVVSTSTGPPATGPTGWLFHLDNQAVAVTRVEYLETSGEAPGWGLAFHMLETTGRPARCRLRTFRTPTRARQTDFNNELIVDLSLDGDAVYIDLTAHELARIDVTLG